jgi:hypothetical protein
VRPLLTSSWFLGNRTTAAPNSTQDNRSCNFSVRVHSRAETLEISRHVSGATANLVVGHRRRIPVPLSMSRIRSEYLGADLSDGSLAVDFLVREEPEDDEDEEEDEGNGEDDEGDDQQDDDGYSE